MNKTSKTSTEKTSHKKWIPKSSPTKNIHDEASEEDINEEELPEYTNEYFLQRASEIKKQSLSKGFSESFVNEVINWAGKDAICSNFPDNIIIAFLEHRAQNVEKENRFIASVDTLMNWGLTKAAAKEFFTKLDITIMMKQTALTLLIDFFFSAPVTVPFPQGQPGEWAAYVLNDKIKYPLSTVNCKKGKKVDIKISKNYQRILEEVKGYNDQEIITLYHATSWSSAASIVSQILILQRTNDFGPGFYLNTSESSARAWCWRNRQIWNHQCAIIVYHVPKQMFAGFMTKTFATANQEWKDIIWEAYTNGGATPQNLQAYDVVVGPICSNPHICSDIQQTSANLTATSDNSTQYTLRSSSAVTVVQQYQATIMYFNSDEY